MQCHVLSWWVWLCSVISQLVGVATSVMSQLVGVAMQCLFSVGGCGYAVSCSQLVGVAKQCHVLSW